jgi:tetratricopeptide (TPR) repeat protein
VTRSSRAVLATCLATTLVAHMPTARAQEAAPPVAPTPAPGSKEAKSASRAHYNRGRELQAASAFADAIAEYQAGYALYSKPDFLFNIAQCYRLLGERVKAIDHYRRYLAAAPNGDGAAEAHEHIATLEAAAPPPAPETKSTEPPVAQPAEASPLVDTKPPEPKRPMGVWQYAGMGTAGLGLVAGGIAIYSQVRATQLQNEVDDIDPTMPYPPWANQAIADGEVYRNRTIGFGIAAGVLVLGGGALFLWGPRPSAAADTPRVSFAPSLGHDHAVLFLNGTF